jgi:hypothetical protein
MGQGADAKDWPARTDGPVSLRQILTLAERESGAYGFADAGVLRRAARLVDWINERGPYRPDQVEAMQGQVLRLLVKRLQLALDRQRYPEIAKEPIERPVFVVGFARSGTTLLHSLLAEDPEAHAPQSWHVLTPSPPPGAGPVCAGRMADAQRAVDEWMAFCPAQRPMHPYIDKGALQLVEDEEILCLDFRYAYPYHLYRAPSLDVSAPLGDDPVESLRFHREVLQHFQWNTGKTRWMCKGVNHQANLRALFEVYPDALCVWPHRPMGDIFASLISLVAAVYDTIQGAPRDWTAHARATAEGMKASLDRLMGDPILDDPRVMHIPFREIAADPVAAVGKVCARRGEPFSAAFEARARAWLADPENQVDRYGRYPYSYEAFGLDKAWIEDLFAPYSRRFGL